MMNSILDQLYFGELSPSEVRLDSAEYKTAKRDCAGARAALRALDLGPEAEKRLEELEMDLAVLYDMEAQARFRQGFRLAVRLMLGL